MAIYSGFSHNKWWFSIVMLVYQRVSIMGQWWIMIVITGEEWFMMGYYWDINGRLTTYISIVNGHRRKVWSQTSDLWTDAATVVGRAGKKRVSRKKIKVREKVEKSRSILFFQCFVAPEGRKVGSLKQGVRSHQGKSETKNARRCGAKQI